MARTSSLLAKYSELYKKNPRSRVFAPLAQTYRKLGMLDEALKVLSTGIKRHPGYVMGYMALAHCYYDQGQVELAYNTIRPFVSSNLENISLQKLFAQICLKLNYQDEALETFKYLLLLNPKDEAVAQEVSKLEDTVAQNETIETSESNTTLENFIDNSEEWMQVDFTQPHDDENEKELEEVGEGWSQLENFKKEVEEQELKVDERDIDDEYFFEEYDHDLDDSDTDIKARESRDERPIVTHTLVDLYIRQGYVNKATELLQSILDLHPDDESSRKKLEELKKIEKVSPHLEAVSNPEEDLANLVERKIKSNETKQHRELENALNRFLFKVQITAQEKLDEL